tara:strand:+ start:250 stop:876 length:627 start_codon:yes stop_codon:yes gene_type:complete
MKKLAQSVLSLSIIASFFACGGAEKKAEETTTEEITENFEIREVPINPAESSVMWEGNVVGVYTHSGTVSVVDGVLTMEGSRVIDGSFVVDLTSMQATDDNYNPEEGKSKDKLIEHLSSPDFFDVGNFPTASFEILEHNIDNNTITGNLTVRGITKEETVEDVIVNLDSGIATGKLVFDRHNYEVAFKHPAQDVVISDDVTLKVNLKI